MGVVGGSPLQGVYTLGSYAKNYPAVLDLTFPISERSSGEFVLSGIEIGSILVAGDTVLVSWYNHNNSTYGVDKLDYDNKLSGAYFETRLISLIRSFNANYTKFTTAYCDKPVSTTITIQYSKDYGVTWVETSEMDDTDRKIVYAVESVENPTIMMKVITTALDNTAPSIEGAKIYTS